MTKSQREEHGKDTPRLGRVFYTSSRGCLVVPQLRAFRTTPFFIVEV